MKLRYVAVLFSLLSLAATQTTTVPPVTRMTIEQAVVRMESVGLIGTPIEVPGIVCGHRVVGSIPAANTIVEMGSEVLVLYSSGTLTPYCK